MIKERHIPYRDLGLTLLALTILYCFFPKVWLLFLMGGFLVVGIAFEGFRKLNHITWVKITNIMSKIFPPIFLSLIFFLVLIPIGFVFQLFNKSKSNVDTSNFSDIDEPIDLSYFERVW